MRAEPSADRPSRTPGHVPAVLVTRPSPAGRQLADQMEAAGLRVHFIPVLEILPPEDVSPLNVAAARVAAGAYDWLVLTSANGVRAFSDALARVTEVGSVIREDDGPEGVSAIPRASVAVVGASTAAAARREGWKVDLVPETYTGEGLIEAFGHIPLKGARVLLPVAEAARAALPDGLRARGAEVDVVVAYRSGFPGSVDAERMRGLVRDGGVDLVTLASPSAAEGLLDLVGSDALAVPAAVIGPVTAEAARAMGFHVVAVAHPHTAEGLVSAVVEWASRFPLEP